MASFSESFTQADGDLANGWANDAALGGSDPMVRVKSNKGSTDNNTVTSFALKAHGLAVTAAGSVWQIDCDLNAPLEIGNGGVQVTLVSTADGHGWGFFIGNAVHVQKYAVGGSHTNVTNDDRPGATGMLANHVTMTHDASSVMNVWLDDPAMSGAPFSTVTDASQGAGATVMLSLQNTSSPALESTIDNLVVKDSIGYTGATVPGVPSALAATPGNAQVALAWTAPADGGSAITDYRVLYRRTP